MSTYGIVSRISAPELDSVTQPNLIKFGTEYTAYQENVEDVSISRDEASRILPATIRQCLKAKLLKSLCIIREIDGTTTMDQATDESVNAWFDERISAEPEHIAERVRSAVDFVKFVKCDTDPAGAAMEFVLKVIASLDKNNASHVVQDTEKCKELVSKLVHKL